MHALAALACLLANAYAARVQPGIGKSAVATGSNMHARPGPIKPASGHSLYMNKEHSGHGATVRPYADSPISMCHVFDTYPLPSPTTGTK